ncbi:MAG: hypothetical protein L6U99_07305 [Clostridium sp.]|nr:MAG: hypothetical protein L6U99_07305 [Clostridium sp.]
MKKNNYKELEYVSMFSVNSGTIKNLKLLNTEQIQRSIYASIFGISPFVGLNKASGIIENCSIVDLRDPVKRGGWYYSSWWISYFGLCL